MVDTHKMKNPFYLLINVSVSIACRKQSDKGTRATCLSVCVYVRFHLKDLLIRLDVFPVYRGICNFMLDTTVLSKNVRGKKILIYIIETSLTISITIKICNFPNTPIYNHKTTFDFLFYSSRRGGGGELSFRMIVIFSEFSPDFITIFSKLLKLKT